MTTQVQLTTADELLHYQSDGYRYELVREELKKMDRSRTGGRAAALVPSTYSE